MNKKKKKGSKPMKQKAKQKQFKADLELFCRLRNTLAGIGRSLEAPWEWFMVV